jgi:solute carrier family 25 uncoupling protein 8/9
MNDGMYCYLTCAFAAGFNGVIFGSPLDCLTTRHMSSPGVYKNPIDCLLTTIRNEGIFALYKGFIPNVARLSGFNIVLWVTIENIKKF